MEPAPGAREQLIPGAEPGPHPVDLNRQRLIERRALPWLGPLDGREQLRPEHHVVFCGLRQLWVLERLERVLDQGAVLVGLGSLGGCPQQDGSFRQLPKEIVMPRFALAD